MIPRTQALVFSVVFLCGPQEALLSPLGHCSKNAICSFEAAMDFQDAKKACSKYNGQLYQFSSKDELGQLTLLSRLDGKYWVQSTDGTGLNCRAVSVMKELNATVVWEPCRDKKLDGFFCQFGLEDVCSPLQAPGGSSVTYTLDDFEFGDSEVFLLGTIAVARKVGTENPDSKHLCFYNWRGAPWTCEVLGGGCEHSCERISTEDFCVCPAGHVLHRNNISCSRDPCAECAQGCQREGDTVLCKCTKGYRLDQDGKTCVDVDECKEEDRCTTGDQVCVNTPGGYECKCRERSFVLEEGMCVNVTICKSCEHDCEKSSGEYRCVCRRGFMVSPLDPTSCEQNCTERDCRCMSKDGQSCSCLPGYVKDIVNDTDVCTDINECESQKMCDHRCENLFGSYRCLCDKGFQLQGKDRCVRLEEEEDEDDGSGSSSPGFTPTSTPASAHPALLPSYIKTGSVLGITVFIVLGAGLLVFLLRNAFKRCGKIEFSSLKRPDLDIFYLQQVTTETYKRLSFDKQFKSDSQKPELNQ